MQMPDGQPLQVWSWERKRTTAELCYGGTLAQPLTSPHKALCLSRTLHRHRILCGVAVHGITLHTVWLLNRRSALASTPALQRAAWWAPRCPASASSVRASAPSLPACCSLSHVAMLLWQEWEGYD